MVKNLPEAEAYIYEVAPPSPAKETVVPYYSYAAEWFEVAAGRAPSRQSLFKYIHEKPGFPVKKNGPYVKVPIFIQLKGVYTTKEAMARFGAVVAELQERHGVRDLDINNFRAHRSRR